jgi:hypothetical protein
VLYLLHSRANNRKKNEKKIINHKISLGRLKKRNTYNTKKKITTTTTKKKFQSQVQHGSASLYSIITDELGQSFPSLASV